MLSAAGFIALALALALPVDWALQFLGTASDRIFNAGLVLALVCFVGTAGLLAPRWATALLLLPLLVAALLARLLFYGLVHFSGQGFGPELFLHFEPESLRIAWYEYDDLVYRAAAVALAGATAFWVMLRFANAERISRRATLAVGLASLATLVAGHEHLPEWRLWESWRNWERPGGFVADSQSGDPTVASEAASRDIPESRSAPWTATGLVETDLPITGEISAEAPDQPRNLVLLYVEALTTGIVRYPDYPGLMPNLQKLVDEHGWIDEFHTSSFVTIEGVANTQCGLLFPFRGHGSGFAGRGMLAQALPCLGDVLATAGYHQTYILGGGPMSFTGKGAFLDAHGYDDLRGWEYWESQGHAREPGHWGMGDVATLEQVRLTIAERQRKDRPFNVTSLTVGSHIPGYSYDGCKPYGEGEERYLNALHCTDQVIADWIARLQTEGLLANTLLVIVGDHPVFANPEMERLFGDAAHDTRLQLIVLGENLARPQHERGAGFDLAPTLLDLLGIRHNARFALGRALTKPHDRPDYLVTRRGDIHAGRPVHNAPGGCDQADAKLEGPPSLPLSACEKRDLLDLLHELTAAYSHQPEPIDCSRETAATVRVPTGEVGPVRFTINGRDWSNRFSWRGRMTHPTEPGLYALALDREGRPLAASFLPAERIAAAEPEPLPEDVMKAHALLVAWRPESGSAVDLSGILPMLPARISRAGAWLGRPGEGQALEGSMAAEAPATVLSVDGGTCRLLDF
jgi:hypothetical protein